MFGHRLTREPRPSSRPSSPADAPPVGRRQTSALPGDPSDPGDPTTPHLDSELPQIRPPLHPVVAWEPLPARPSLSFSRPCPCVALQPSPPALARRPFPATLTQAAGQASRFSPERRPAPFECLPCDSEFSTSPASCGELDVGGVPSSATSSCSSETPLTSHPPGSSPPLVQLSSDGVALVGTRMI